MAISNREVLEARRSLGEMLVAPGVIRGDGNFDAVVSGVPVFRQRGVTGEDGASIVVQEITDALSPPESRRPSLIVKITSARPKS